MHKTFEAPNSANPANLRYVQIWIKHFLDDVVPSVTACEWWMENGIPIGYKSYKVCKDANSVNFVKKKVRARVNSKSEKKKANLTQVLLQTSTIFAFTLMHINLTTTQIVKLSGEFFTRTEVSVSPSWVLVIWDTGCKFVQNYCITSIIRVSKMRYWGI